MKTMKFGRTALVLALAMTIILSVTGGTIAWFTDEVTSANNVIEAGNLDIEVQYMTPGMTEWADLTSTTEVFNKDAKWEPGHTQAVALKVKNAGNLAVKFQAGVNLISETEGTNVYDKTFKLSDSLEVYNTVIQAENDPIGQIYMDLLLGSRKGALGNGIVLEKGAFDKAIETPFESPLMPGEAAMIGFTVTMPTTVGNEANHKTGTDAPVINFGVKVVAAQAMSESDSFGSDYDKEALYPVHNAGELAEALAAGKSVKLTQDVAVAKNTTLTVASGANVLLDLNGKKITTTADKSGNQELFLVKGNMTVKNGSLVLEAKNNQGWGAMATLFDVTAGGVLNMEGVTAKVSGTDMNFIVHLNNWGKATLYMNDCDLDASYVGVRAFNSGYDMNTVTIKNSDFTGGGRMFWVHNYTTEGKDDSTLTLDIYNNNNTCTHAKPVRFGFDDEVYFDLNGTQIVEQNP